MFLFKTPGTSIPEIDSIGYFRLTNDDPCTFHLVSATKKKVLVSLVVSFEENEFKLEKEWSREIKSPVWDINASIDIPSRDFPLIFTAREDGHFHAYTHEGVPAWSHDFMATISPFKVYQDPFMPDQVVLIPSLDKTLRLLTAKDGKLLWGDTFASGVNVATHQIDDKEEIHYIAAGGNDHTLRLYSRSNKGAFAYKMDWYNKFESYVRDISISREGLVAAVADDGYLKVIDVKNGEEKWRHEHNSFAWKCKVIDGPGIVLSTSFQVPIQVDETGELLGNPGVISCHEVTTGKLKWSTRPEDGINIQCWEIVERRGKWLAILGLTSGKIIVLDGMTGKALQEFESGFPINQMKSLEINDRLVILACQEDEKESLILGISSE